MAKTPFSVPKGTNFGSERHELWFRKARTVSAQTLVPDSTNFLVPDNTNIG